MKVVWSSPALDDLESIQQYIARDSAVHASRFVQRLLEAVDLFEQSPELGQRMIGVGDTTIREFAFRNYRIIYRLEAERVLMLAIVHAGRDLYSLRPKPWERE